MALGAVLLQDLPVLAVTVEEVVTSAVMALATPGGNFTCLPPRL